MNVLVKIIMSEDGQEGTNDWHLVNPANKLGNAPVCSGEFFGEGESGAIFEVKTVKRGGITRKKCLDTLKIYKSVKL